MIIANLATYPPRLPGLPDVVVNLARQVDVLNVVLNEYEKAPQVPSLPGNVNFIIPKRDLKDTGKFLPRVGADDFVFLVDDDIEYPPDYVKYTLHWLEKFGSEDVIVGYHGSFFFPDWGPSGIPPRYRQSPAAFDRNNPIHNRRVAGYETALDRPIVVHQLGTGVCAMRGRNLPPFDYMETSQKFVDVRLARWSYERQITQICLPRNKGWLKSIRYDESIFQTFTRQLPPHVLEEIMIYSRPRQPANPVAMSPPDVIA